MKDALHAYLADAIPLYRAMDARVHAADTMTVSLSAPLAPNTNHQSTAFGGSVASLATLACWGWLWVWLRKAGVDARLVVARSEIDYLKPITTALHARCDAPGVDAHRALLDALARKGRGRVELAAVVQDDAGLACARYRGWFVAKLVSPGASISASR